MQADALRETVPPITDEEVDHLNNTLEEAARVIRALVARTTELEAAVAGLIRIADAVRYTAGLGKNQIARVEAARALIAKEQGHAE